MATFHLLGPLEVRDDDGRPLELGGPKQRAVLAVLLLDAGRVVPIARIVQALWGDEPPASATGTLQAYVSNLRRALGAGGRAASLVTQAPGYRLDVAPDEVDARRFEAAVAEAGAALDDGRAADAATALDGALALWRGGALPELADDRAALAEVQRLEELRLVAHERWAKALLALGRHAEVATALPSLVEEHPLRSRLRAALMLALYRSGRQAEALRTYAEGRTVLRAELGAEPEPELQALEEQILLQDPALDWRAAAPTAAGQDADDPRDLLVGRDAELATLERALISAASGRGAVVLLAGEAGIGKTRLAEAAAALARRRGALVAWGRSFESEGTPAFWPWIEVLRQALPDELAADVLAELGPDAALLARLLPELGPAAATGESVADDDALRFSLAAAAARALHTVAARRTLLVVLDDLHWADGPSLRLLRAVGADVATRQLVVVGTFRDDEVAGELADTLAALAGDPHVERLALRGLTEGEVGRVLADRLPDPPADDVIRDVADRTGGNPFFVGEVARLLVEPGAGGGGAAGDVPPGVLDVIRARVERLPEGADRLLAAAALGGREFDLRIAAEVAGLDDEDAVLDLIDAALAAHLLEEGSRVGRYRFPHALVQDAVVSGLSRARRIRLHRRTAAALAARPRTGRAEDLAELAFHALEGASPDDAEEALGHALEAAAASLAALSFEEAAALCSSALAVMDRTGVGDDACRFTLQLDLGTALRRQGDRERSRAALADAMATARTGLPGERFAEAALQYSGGAWWGWWSELGFADEPAIAALEEALDRLPPGPSARRAELLGRLAIELHFVAGAAERRDQLSAEALAMARELGGRPLTHALAARHVARWEPGTATERRALADELVAAARSSRSTELEAYGHHFLLLADLERGDAAGAAAQLEEGERLVRTLPLPHLTAQVAWSRSMLAAVAGRFDEAERLQADALATTSRWGEAEAFRTWTAQLVTLRWEQGRGMELADPLRRLVAGEAINVNWKTVLALVLADEGDLGPAQELFDDVAAERFEDVPHDLGRSLNLAIRAVTATLLEDGARAELLLPYLEPLVGTHVVQAARMVYAGPVSFHVGCLRGIVGDRDAALGLLRQAADEAARVGSPSFRARALLGLARLRAPGAAALAAEGLEVATGLGMARVAARARAVLDAARSD